MNITKEQIEEVQNDKFFQALVALMGLDLNLAAEYAKEALEKESCSNSQKSHSIFNALSSALEDLEKEGTLKHFEKDGKKFYYTPGDECDPYNIKERKEYEAPKSEEKRFLMTKEQFDSFCKAYTKLVEAENKLRYMFGIEFNEGGCGFGFSNNAREIIWTLIRAIFGDDNTEDIADFLYGNSNFDDAKNLYDELI